MSHLSLALCVANHSCYSLIIDSTSATVPRSGGLAAAGGGAGGGEGGCRAGGGGARGEPDWSLTATRRLREVLENALEVLAAV